ncbi:MAG: GNAT family N-acetyltransferase [Candidatus Vogelbacteria bacterium]|nr:GNAT family N-acetyltransferase [Candidatus Vogelbacteria bacterium]
MSKVHPQVHYLRNLTKQGAVDPLIKSLNELFKYLTKNPSVTKENLSIFLAPGGSEALVYIEVSSGRPVAYGEVHLIPRLNRPSATIESIVVDPEYRGLGIGRAIMHTLLEIAKQKGAKTVTLTSNPTRQRARKLYRDLGFKLKKTGFYMLDLEAQQ